MNPQLKSEEFSKLLQVLDAQKLNKKQADELFTVLANHYVTTRTLAKLLGLTDRRIRQLVDLNVISREHNGEYKIATVIPAYIEYLRQQTLAGNTVEYKLEHALLTQVKRQKEELQLKELQGELIRKADVEIDAFNFGRQIRDSILNVIPRITSLVAAETNPTIVQNILTTEVTKALETISTDEPIH
ncbi:MAG: hypothetical protein ACHP6H_02090 [Legionellales bacterium]